MNARFAPFWTDFLARTGRPPETTYADAYPFDLTEENATALLALVLKGQKRATCSSLHFFERNSMPTPKPGDLCIILDWAGNPHCVVETTDVVVMHFRDMTFDICRREGEDDSLASWQRSHIKFFTAEGAREGYAFSWDMPVVFEDFKVVYAP